MKIIIITGQNSYSTIEEIIKSIKNHEIKIEKAPTSVSAFLTENMTRTILKTIPLSNYDLILIPGFVQWDTKNLEKELSVDIRKGPEFASDLPIILRNLTNIQLSNKIPANKLYETSGVNEYNRIIKEQIEKAKDNLGHHTFYINEKRSDIMVGRGLPPPIIAEIVNCSRKSNETIIMKAKHFIESGADIIDIGCVANKPNPGRIKEIISVLRKNFKILLSIDSMEKSEILAAIDEDIDMILSLDLGNYKDFLHIPKSIPIVILPTNIKKAIFPKEPETRVNNLFKLTQELQNNGFRKLIADPLLETPIAPGISNSLKTYFLYNERIKEENYRGMELPVFFGISNVVELMDIDSVGINGLLASIAIELDMGVLFTVEHSTKLMGGVRELKECVKLNYISKYKKSPPINQGIQVFRAKGKVNQDLPNLDKKNAVLIDKLNADYVPDQKGYVKIYVNHYNEEIYTLFFSNEHKILKTLIGISAEALSKKIIELELTTNLHHISYISRELKKAEICLHTGKSYIQDETI